MNEVLNWRRIHGHGHAASGNGGTYWVERISDSGERPDWRLSIRFRQESRAGLWDCYPTARQAKAEAERLEGEEQ